VSTLDTTPTVALTVDNIIFGKKSGRNASDKLKEDAEGLIEQKGILKRR
jgi:hypothetical protein